MTTTKASPTLLLTSRAPKAIAEAFEELFAPDVDRLVAAVPGAVAGRDSDVRRYLDAWRTCTEKVLEAVETAGAVAGAAAGGRGEKETAQASVLREPAGLALVESGPAGEQDSPASTLRREYLDQGAVEAPISPWVSLHGERAGLVLALVGRVRSLLGAPAMDAPDGKVAFERWSLDREAWSRFRSLAEGELRSTHDSRAVLARVRELFALDLTELAKLFGVSRQAATVWLRDGVPPARRAKAGAVLELAELLSRKLRPGRTAGVVRRPSAEHGGRSFLELIAEDRHEELLERVRESFDWAATA